MKVTVIFASLMAAVAMAAPAAVEPRADEATCFARCAVRCRGPLPVVAVCLAACAARCASAAEDGEEVEVDFAKLLPEVN
ncbi:hypothetical protein MFIFM68171_06636 [Madurella fahalii]|uniref:Uncharacterized protein n=1 Tax=Madurella fahalii TaxID=1157608 RepID=A0ABQ0GF79_9PEZI